ncbi:MAG: DNA polymerase I [Chlamydiae bacterium]|nr:DNA polymerase I [Chlamydiota bacterium]
MKSIYVIDASGYLYRSYHAIQNLTNDKGESTNALYGFIRSLMKLFKDFHPDHVVAIFDGPAGTEKRKEMYPEYKAQRVAMPEDLRYQIGWAQEFCDLLGIPKLVIPKVEADDTMGAIAKWAGNKKTKVYLCTSDKDLCQLVNDNVFILNTHKDNLILDSKKVEEVYGIPPEKMIDFLAIMGDASDNVPGLPGFGPKTAISLLQEFDSLDEILAHPEKVPGKKKQETLVQEKEKALISRKLVTIDTNVEIPKEDSFFELKEPNREKLIKFYSYMRFTSLLREIEQEVGEDTPEEVSYQLVDDENALKDLLKVLTEEKEICFDTETTHWRPLEAELVGIGFCVEPTKAWYVPTNGKLGLDKVLESLKPLFENPKIGFYGQNVKYDWHILTNYGIHIKNISFDTILASYILNSHSRRHSLDTLALQYFDKVKIALTDLIGKGKKAITMREVPVDKACEYCCEDADYTCRLKLILEKELKSRKLQKLFSDLELPLMSVLAKMERHGMYVDVPFLETMSVEVNKAIKTLEGEIHTLAGKSFNIKSPKQLSEILFVDMGIKPPRKTATGLSTNADVLEGLKEKYPIAEKVLEYRTVEKLRSTYIETLPQEVNSKTHRIHPTFNQSVAATGRLTCQDPNLQNIPVRTEIGRRIREAFRPEKKGWKYLSADYSQIELRLVAHFSEDPKLISAFNNNEDIHAHTAATILNIPISKVTKEQRQHAKAVNFGMIYGQQAFGLAREVGISIEEARAFIDEYFNRYKRVKDFLESYKENARKTGKAVTLVGRERAIPEINNKNVQIRTQAERLAINTPLQGTAADLIKIAMLAIDKKLQKEQNLGYMVLQIHDELIFELPDFELPFFDSLVRKEMEGVFKLKVPLVVDITVGNNWKEC